MSIFTRVQHNANGIKCYENWSKNDPLFTYQDKAGLAAEDNWSWRKKRGEMCLSKNCLLLRHIIRSCSTIFCFRSYFPIPPHVFSLKQFYICVLENGDIHIRFITLDITRRRRMLIVFAGSAFDGSKNILPMSELSSISVFFLLFRNIYAHGGESIAMGLA